MNYAKLEQIAHGLLPLLPITSGSSWRIDAWRVLEQTLPKAGFNFCVAEMEELEECAAFTVPEENLVVLRKDVYDGLFAEDVFSRSTVVHELSHIVLKHAVTLHRGATVGQHQFYEDSEWQAKALTAAIMMPVAACRAAQTPEQLSAFCGTSVQASGYRIEKLIERSVLKADRFANDLFS